MANFDFCGQTDILLTYNNSPIHSAVVRPYSYNIAPQVRRKTISFSLDDPKNVAI
ncbi:hypothetical protein BGW36DRAFT_369008 [Talaromyces proteolyticus]|uniref:Uncharacterized protein n=1 Tax=Talaromyces proteolyticus TaxID=1131652 RepID=A0AAD4KZY4_9EURO|nr:uncharacterized protein BGW36DRAFT_369008 [Talaromyces proteolyticus]KAH8703231.1 hypothetical protein BGW36DRAFT_369008 [Talaromyces proteolyticus]